MDGYSASTYGDAFADVYDDWYAGAGDTDAAVRALAALAGRAGGPVLELGVGTGRMAVPLAATGVEVWGVDASAAMLERLGARGATVRAVLGDMADVAAALGPAAPSFGVAVAACNTFFLLASEAAQAACLQSVAAVLRPGGVVALECFVPADPPQEVQRVLEPRTVAVDHVVLTATEHDPAAQTVRGQHIELRATGTTLRPWMLRYATPAQLDELAGGAGLRLVERWSGWDRRPFADGDAMHVSLYEAQ